MLINNLVICIGKQSVKIVGLGCFEYIIISNSNLLKILRFTTYSNHLQSKLDLADSTLIIVAFAAVANYAELGDSRQFAIFNAAKDESWQQRNDREHFAIDTIQKNPILGDFGTYLNQGGVSSENVGADMLIMHYLLIQSMGCCSSLLILQLSLVLSLAHSYIF